MVTKEKIFSQTRGGLDVILSMYPEAAACVKSKQAKFKMRRDERTPSAHLFQGEDKSGATVWYVKDFGSTERGMDCVNLWMHVNHMDPGRFGEACLQIAKRFGITDELDKSVNVPEFKKRPATADEQDGEMQFRLKADFTDEELRFLGPKVTRETVAALHWYSVELCGRVKDRQITERHSTDTYPIFVRECLVEPAKGEQPEKKFYKLYEPKNPDKGRRFSYFPTGAKPSDYINGLVELRAARAAIVAKHRQDWEATHTEEEPFDDTKFRMPEVILCSGERDALCVRSQGYHPLWLNSETAALTRRQMDELQRLATIIYNIPDIDATGVRAGSELALRFIDIHTVWLPRRDMEQYTDHRGKRLKDLRDWMELRPTRQDFRQLLMLGKPARFWVERTDKSGNPRQEIDTEYLFHFLQLNGFHLLRDDHQEDPRFVRVQGNVVSEVTPRTIRSFVRQWAADGDTTQSHGVRNLILNTMKLNAASLEALPDIAPDFTSATAGTQLFFFRNGYAEVSGDGVTFVQSVKGLPPCHVWEDNVLQHDYSELPPMFRYSFTQDEEGEPVFNLEITDCLKSHFFGYLINSSRLYWRKEMEQQWPDEQQRAAYQKAHPFDILGEGLTEVEQAEQVRNLLSKMFALGYMLHQYKTPSRAWALMLMDGKVGDIDESNGGSGKSFYMEFLSRMRNRCVVPLRRTDPEKNEFWTGAVTDRTQILQLEDASERVRTGTFYDIITGDMTVNPKHVNPFTIPFSRSPKIGITTNYVPSDFDPSSDRRMLYLVFSDYYHQSSPQANDYLETRTIHDDFGKDLLGEQYTEQEWNADLNFALQCVRMYLDLTSRYPSLKIQPTMASIYTRKLKRDMGENFEEWAEYYFAEGSNHLDTQLVRTEVMEDYRRYSNVASVKMKGFTRKLRAFAAVCPWIHEIDPEEFRNSSGRNMVYRSADDPTDPSRKKLVEMVYMRSVEGEKARLEGRVRPDDNERPF